MEEITVTAKIQILTGETDKELQFSLTAKLQQVMHSAQFGACMILVFCDLCFSHKKHLALPMAELLPQGTSFLLILLRVV